ncbi:MAG: alpha-amylase family glycosyl hydrolase, partial [Bacteroidota bacterium]
MRGKTGIFTLLLLCGLAFGQVFGQAVTWTPAHPTVDDSVVITYNAALGNGALSGVDPVFLHTGVITSLSTDPGDWDHQVAAWDAGYDSSTVLTFQGNDVHEIGIRPRNFYGIGQTEEIRALAMVFRNELSTIAGLDANGGDFFIPIFPDSNFSAIFAAPLEVPEILTLNDQITFDVQANEPALITVFQDGVPVAQSPGLTQAFSMTLTGGGYGVHELHFTADHGLTVYTDTTYYVVQPPISIQNVPTGLRDGINYINDSTVTLVLNAPGKGYVYAIGDFSDWRMDPAYLMNKTPDNERFWVEIGGLTPGQEYRFQYFVDHQVRIGDPYAEKVLDQWNDGGVNSVVYPNLIAYPAGKTAELVTTFQTAQQPYNWQNNNFQRPDNRDLVIYELLIRDFVIRHDYATVIDSLDYLQKLGVNAIELMPINEFDGNQSWGYGPAYFFAPDKYYGTKAKLQEFVDECHGRGIAVIIDVVFNHAFGQNPMVRLYQDRNTLDVTPDNPWFNLDAPHPLG